ncbi:MAG: NF038122 family metalloprotease [Phycisphaerae bacterium]|nr:NF038122 family metalloprotease [Phycisphaerae bacterium]
MTRRNRLAACAVLVLGGLSAVVAADGGASAWWRNVSSPAPVLFEPGPRMTGVLYLDGSEVEFETLKITRYTGGSELKNLTSDDLKRDVEAVRARNAGAQRTLISAAGPRSGMNIVFDVSGTLPAGAADALEAVAQYIESQFEDSVTVTIDFSMQNLGGGVLGYTSASFVSGVSYSTVRASLVNDMDTDDVIQSWLPTGSTVPVRYNAYSSTVTNENRVFFTLANYKAAIGSMGGTDAEMVLNTAFSWDYDPSNGVSGSQQCYQSVVAHEVGHVLGFISFADYDETDINAMDLYRFQRTAGANNYNPSTYAEFQTTPRLVDYNAPNDDHNTDLIAVEYRMADGDPYQASHFREQTPSIGIMDPAQANGETFYPNFYRTPDLAVFDAIGWDYSTAPDCNNNGIPDDVDISSGTSEDCNDNDVPDECDISDGTSQDCNNNDVPDECDIAEGTSEDCNNNDIPDECDIGNGTSEDCNGNIIPDECDLGVGGGSTDYNGNGLPDDCEPDCNGNGIPDAWEIFNGWAGDANGNGVPDACEVAPKFEAGFTTANHVVKTVSLQNTYANPVVVCTGQYFYNGKRMIPRVSNVTSSSFDLRLADPTNSSQTYSIPEIIGYWVMEEGVTELNGVKMEAWNYTSTVTDGNGDWTGEGRQYWRSYANPVVLGQVMSANDEWSAFWSQGAGRSGIPSTHSLRTGKHTGDTGLDRANETIGVIVFESVTGASMGGVPFEAWVGPATVQGVLHGTPPQTVYTLQTPMAAPQFVALAAGAGLQGDTAYWTQRHGQAGSGGSTYLLLSLDDDLDRTHLTGEHVAYALLQSTMVWPRVPDFDSDGDVDLKDFGAFQVCYDQAAAGACLPGDLTGEGNVDEQDVPLFLNQMQGPQ